MCGCTAARPGKRMKKFSAFCSCVFLLRKTKLLHFSPLNYCGQRVCSHSSLLFLSHPSQRLSGPEGFRQMLPARSPRNNKLVGSGRREPTGIWKRSFLRKSGFPQETPQGTDSASLRAWVSVDTLCMSEQDLCSLSDEECYKGRTNAGVEGRRSNASMPVGTLVRFV